MSNSSEKKHWMRWWKLGIALALVLVVVFLLLSIPASEPKPPRMASGSAFAWKQDARWNALEMQFREARRIGCEGLRVRIDDGFRQGRRWLALLARSPVQANAPAFDELEKITFDLGTMIAACPGRLNEYIDLVTRTKSLVKRQSRHWDPNSREVRDRLYRLIYGGRGALEEVMLQAPAKSYPALVECDEEPSVTPSYELAGGILHSGDILVSRGGAPTSALIARGNDYPGNFSHVALVHVDRQTGVPSLIEAHIERGVVVSTLNEYLKDVKLRIMLLRLKADLPQMIADPELPHRAAQQSLEEARARHIPFDFAMDFKDPSMRFCSEVVSHAYHQLGVDLWQGTSTISSPGVARWLADFGVQHFETQAPADLEYDPQLTVVTEWRDPDTLWKDHVDNAVIEAMLEGAEQGKRLTYPWYLLAPARVVKAYSAVLNLFGGVGPMPEGMGATGGLRQLRLSKIHKAIQKRVLLLASDFRTRNGYMPPYWELVRLARQARKD